MEDDTEITSNKNGSVTIRKGKVSHICTEKELITEIHKTLFRPEGLVEEVTLINDRQQKALKILDNVEKDLKDMTKQLAGMKGKEEGKGIAIGWVAALISIAAVIGAFIENLLSKK